MTHLHIGPLVAAVTCVVLGITPAFAESAETDAYIATVSQDLDILTGSSAMAEHRATKDTLKAYARDELSVPLRQPVASLNGTPAVVAANMSGAPTVDASGLETARSVHIDEIVDPARYRAPLGTGVEMPTATATLSYLESANGATFDWAYKAAQETALTALKAAETAYAQTGDDAALRAGAIAQLPKIDARLAALRAL